VTPSSKKYKVMTEKWNYRLQGHAEEDKAIE